MPIDSLISRVRSMRTQIGAKDFPPIGEIANGTARVGAFLFNDKLLTVLKVTSVFLVVIERTTNQQNES